MSLADVGVTADSVVLVSHPHNQDDVECCGCVVEKLGHYCLHAWSRENEP